MKLSLLILTLTTLLTNTNTHPIATPSQTACYREQNAQGVWEEVCTGDHWHPPTNSTSTTTSATSPPYGTLISENKSATQEVRRAAKPGRTACYAKKVDGVDVEVCTGDGWVAPGTNGDGADVSSGES
ncbi:hypothetical protein E2P81_ATG11607 [Venturia nashicola]|uniref:Uncharacterized protein n=1 Tax=Venturia nashicola TaxID=86259 RepID=A0A4Z1NDC4_9PEZI|nr:hypothetical protein E6O75_ATG11302 [Venturia nashicola]TLD18697.1 hypothetical protein E2P81_ATG11607 [Venturia nashicola]